MGMAGALIGDTIDYGEWKTGVRVQSVLFSASSVGAKVGQGALTAAFGFVLSAIGYNGALETQAEFRLRNSRLRRSHRDIYLVRRSAHPPEGFLFYRKIRRSFL